MCGRYAITLPPEAVRGFFRYVEQPNFPARTNIAPTQPVPIVTRERSPDGDAARHFKLVRWGFIPSWVKDPKAFPLMINARAETMADKPSFRAALIRRRCLFVADAFYEWQRLSGAKKGASRPFMIRRADGSPMGLAGLWETWLGADGSEIDTACIVTTAANGAMAAVHERMPAILEPRDFDAWLDVDAVAPAQAAQLAMRPPTQSLDLIEVGPGLNKVANDGPEVQRRAEARRPSPAEGTPDLFSR